VVSWLIQLTGSALAHGVSLKRERRPPRESEEKRRRALTSDGGVQPVEVRERERHRAEVHHDPVRVSRAAGVVGVAARHEDAGVAASDVTAAGVVHREVDGGVEGALDRSFDARVQQLPVSQLFDLPREDVVRLAHFLQERRVISDRCCQICSALQQLSGRQLIGQRQAGPEDQ